MTTVIPQFREQNLVNDFDLANGLEGTEVRLPLNVPYYCFKEEGTVLWQPVPYSISYAACEGQLYFRTTSEIIFITPIYTVSIQREG